MKNNLLLLFLLLLGSWANALAVPPLVNYAGRVAVAPGNGSFQDFVTAMRNELGDDANHSEAVIAEIRRGGS